MAKEVHKFLCGVQCRLLTWGNPFASDGKDVIICITGNPGIIDFYFEFCSELFNITGLHICLIGQAGHDIIPNQESVPIKQNEHLFDLNGQIKNKVDLIYRFIDKQCHIHLVGHSIGAWLIIETLREHPNILQRVVSINLLFPTIKEMAATPNGGYVNTILRRCTKQIIYLLSLLNMLPMFALEFLASIYLRFRGLPFYYTKRALKYIDSSIMEKVLFLAYKEMDEVTKLNVDGIKQIKHLTNIIYSQQDGWVPLDYIAELEQFQPQLQMVKVKYPHDFVLKYSNEVAELVTDFIKSRMVKVHQNS